MVISLKQLIEISEVEFHNNIYKNKVFIKNNILQAFHKTTKINLANIR